MNWGILSLGQCSKFRWFFKLRLGALIQVCRSVCLSVWGLLSPPEQCAAQLVICKIHMNECARHGQDIVDIFAIKSEIMFAAILCTQWLTSYNAYFAMVKRTLLFHLLFKCHFIMLDIMLFNLFFLTKHWKTIANQSKHFGLKRCRNQPFIIIQKLRRCEKHPLNGLSETRFV